MVVFDFGQVRGTLWGAYFEQAVSSGATSTPLASVPGAEMVLLSVDARALTTGETFLLRFHEGAPAGSGLRFSGGQNYLFRIPLQHVDLTNLYVQNLSASGVLHFRGYVALGRSPDTAGASWAPSQ